MSNNNNNGNNGNNSNNSDSDSDGNNNNNNRNHVSAIRGPISFSFKRTYKAITLLGEQGQSGYGNRITMPRSALIELNRKSMAYPFLFKLTNVRDQDQVTYCGVMQFDSEEGKVYLPNWIMDNLKLTDFSLVHIEKAQLKQGSFVKLQPYTSDFLDIRDPKMVLEDCLRKFACLTKGDAITINYNTKLYRLLILDLKPENAVCIIECDLTVDFEAPLDYGIEKPDYYEEATANNTNNSRLVVVPFAGNGNKLSASGRTASNNKLLKTINNNNSNNNNNRRDAQTRSSNSNLTAAADFKNDINNSNTSITGIASRENSNISKASTGELNQNQDHHQPDRPLNNNSNNSGSIADYKTDNSNHKIRGIPDHNYQIGYIYFKRHFASNKNNHNKEQ